MQLLYKTLFELKLSHEYYVTESDGTTFFALTAKKDRDNFWANQFTLERDAVNTDLDFQFPASLRDRYKQYGLKLLPSFSGCKVLVRVKKQTQADGSILYSPIAALPHELDINIALISKNNFFDQYTNARMERNIPAIYFFSNETLLNPKTIPAAFPFLYCCNTAPAFDAAHSYEQGEIALFNGTNIRESYKTKAGLAWNDLKGGAFANENDRLLVPTTFIYAWPGSSATWAEFTLQDRHGAQIANIVVDGNSIPFSQTTLDFSAALASIATDDPFSFPDMVYTLLVVATGGFSRQHQLIFSDNLYNNRQNWGVVSLKVQPANTEYALTDTDGNLIFRLDAAGTIQDAPVFDVPVTSRYTYWRYLNDKNNELSLTADLTGCLVKEDNVLLTITPRAIAKNYYLLPKSGTNPIYVPNPDNYQLKTDAYQRFFFDVLVPASDAFPIVKHP